MTLDWRHYAAGAAVIALLAVLVFLFWPEANRGEPSFVRDPLVTGITAETGALANAQGLEVEGQLGRPASPEIAIDFDWTLPADRGPASATQSLVLGVFDQVPYAAKSHVTVRYGASIVEERIGPISVGSTFLVPYDESVVVGAEGLMQPVSADRFQLALAGRTAPPLAIVIERADAPPLAFTYNFDEAALTGVLTRSIVAFSQVEPILESADTLNISAIEAADAPRGQVRFDVSLPDEGAPVTAAYLVFQAVPDQLIEIAFAGLIADAPAADLITVQLAGFESDGRVRLELMTPDGQMLTAQPASNGQLIFPRPDADLFRARFVTDNDVTYFPSGRWIARDQVLPDRLVYAPDYVNAGGEMNDYARWQQSVRRSRVQTRYTELYAPHTRAWWSGAANKMTRFRAEYFYNNIGFHDIDVMRANRDQCEVGFYVGESLVESRQMRLHERTVSILSENLSLESGHCVLVHNVAPGKSIQSYEDLLRLHRDYQPDFMVFELSPSIFYYMTPVIAETFFGFASGRSPVAAFDLNEAGDLVYVPPAADWIEHTVPSSSTLPSGAPLSTAFLLPEGHTPPEVDRAWEVFSRIIGLYRTEFPETEIYIEAAYENARCAAAGTCGPAEYNSAVTGARVASGPPAFYDRLEAFCASHDLVCTMGHDGGQDSLFSEPLLYENDFHFTEFGNHWLAHLMAADIAADRAANQAAESVAD
ncbi:hypothetical protein [Hyphobacterium sp.]|uniref:hypothetical protein n=1 Tax=Hyphobacterium sp. TaxID=2004662 RepID=UPI003BABE3C4